MLQTRLNQIDNQKWGQPEKPLWMGMGKDKKHQNHYEEPLPEVFQLRCEKKENNVHKKNEKGKIYYRLPA